MSFDKAFAQSPHNSGLSPNAVRERFQVKPLVFSTPHLTHFSVSVHFFLVNDTLFPLITQD
jgi:hypothetical protein